MIWTIITIVGALALGIYALLQYVTGNKSYWKKQGVYVPTDAETCPLWDKLRFKIPFHTLDKIYYNAYKKKGVRYGGQIVFRHPVLFVIDPELIKCILIKDFDHFVNRRVFEFGKSDPTFDLMLLNRENQEWKDLRATMSPTFTTGKIKRMFGVFDESGKKMVNFLKDRINQSDGQGVELRDVCGRYTMDVIASAAFGVDSQNFQDKDSQFAIMGRKMQDRLKGVLLLKFALLLSFPSAFRYINLQFFEPTVIEFFNDVLHKSMKYRAETGEIREDFLQLMIEAQAEQAKGQTEDEDKEVNNLIGLEGDKVSKVPSSAKVPLTDDVILAQCNLFFLAGFDVLETLLMFTTYELAIHPEIQERLFHEINDATEGGELNYNIINELEYLDMVISEGLRKYPAAVRAERRCNLDYKVPDSDFTIKKGTHVVVPVYGIHYDEEYYPDPEKFDPERFSQENKAKRHPCTYLPFGLGPRHCIAMRYAILEGKTAIAQLVKNFIIEPCEKTHIPMKFSRAGVMKPDGGMWLNLSPRKSGSRNSIPQVIPVNFNSLSNGKTSTMKNG